MTTINLTVTIPDDQMARVQEAMSARGLTLKSVLIGQIIQIVHQYEADRAAGAIGTISAT